MGTIARMRLWHNYVLIVALAAVVIFGARLLGHPAPAKHWDECKAKMDETARAICAEFR